MPIPGIIVHGGAGTIHADVRQAYAEGTRAAAEAGQSVLDAGGIALDAAVAAVVALEDNPVFNAGTGSTLTTEGLPQCDAFVMTNAYRSGAVAAIYGVRNAVLAARAVMEHSPHLLIAGIDAEAFAAAHGVPRCAPQELIVERRLKRWQELRAQGIGFTDDPEKDDENAPLMDVHGTIGDTVGACVIDKAGGIAVASSTGGILMKLPGRVGDTPVIGTGSYCGPAGAVTCTGHGEAVMRVCLAKHCYDLLEAGKSAEEAAQSAINHLVSRINGKAGLIAIDAGGTCAWATATRNIAVGLPGRTLLPVSGHGHA